MNFEELKTKFPKVYKACVDIGIEQERDRVVSHIELADKTGATKTALNAIRRGLTMSPSLFAAYVQAGRSRVELEARLEDEQALDEALLNVRLPRRGNSDTGAGAVLRHLQGLLDTKSGDANIEDLEVGE